MKKLILLSTFFISISVHALPNCPSDTSVRWHNCFGTINYNDGAQYVGEFKDDKYHGQGTYTYADGTKYVGEIKDGMFHGQGTLTWPDGDYYVGEFKDDKRHGQGTQTGSEGTWVGEFKEGLIIKGTHNYVNDDIFPDGTVYDGEFGDFYEWLPDGEGTFTYIDGSIYSGEVWVEVRHGKGILTLPNGEIKDGYFRSGSFIPDLCKARGLKKGSFDFNLCVLKLIEDHPSGMRPIRK